MLESARKIAHNLLPPILGEFGLKDALEELEKYFNNSQYYKNISRPLIKAHFEVTLL